MTMRPVWIAILLAAGTGGFASPAAAAGAHKLKVSDPAAAERLARDGAVRVADYGSFQVLDLPAGIVPPSDTTGLENLDEQNVIELNAGAIDTRIEASPRRQVAPESAGGRRLHLVQFAGPVRPEWLAELEAGGARVVTYLPHNAYLVYGGAAAVAAVKSLRSKRPHVQWEGSYLEDDKIQPRARLFDATGAARALATDRFAIQMVDDPEANAATLALIDGVRRAPVERKERKLGYLTVIVRLPPEETLNLAARPDVVSIDLYAQPRKFDERQDIIVAGRLSGNGPSGPGYLAWLADRGFTQAQFTASGLLVDVTDSGIDNGTVTPNHFALYTGGDTGQPSRVGYSRLEGTANAGSTTAGCDGHGNLNAHIIGGYVALTNFPHTDSAGYRYGLGVCPFVRVGASVIFDPDTFTSPTYEDLAARAYRDGARISSDSWGADTAGDYDVDAQSYDALVRDAQPAGSAVPVAGNQPMTFVFAAGNAGSSAQTVGSPGTAKNVITVAAAENVHSHATTNGGNDASGSDGCATPDTEANSANDIVGFSSRGPCSDQRRKPEISAPGTHITGGVAQQTRAVAGTGNDLACFDGTGVCALPGSGTTGNTNNFFPLGQQFYSTSSGTSHSTPAVAGGCALIYQHFLNQGLNAPSPAMVKAYLVDSARYMTGVSANDTLWSNNQGFGMMNLGMAFDGAPWVRRDQRTNDVFTATGQTRAFPITIGDAGRPIRVALAWTDAPGATTGNAYKNNLDLTVAAGGRTYRGNVFSGALSATGGTADARNNLECVFLPAGVTGAVLITVSAANINSDGVPNYGGTLDQDFALAVYNATEGASNQPPALAPIGNRSATVSNLVSFAVRASDPFDGDVIALSASNLPPWATFAAATNAGAVTNVFSGTPPTTGVFSIAFRAEDKDGAVEEIVTLAVVEKVCGVIFSEYVEGSGNNKAIEIFNGSPSPISLAASNYVVQVYANGGTSPNSTIALTGSVAAAGAYVLTHSSAGAALLAYAQQTSGSLTFNGDDAVVLRVGGASGTVVDSLGQVGFDPGSEWGTGVVSTADNTLRRKSAVTVGDAVPSDAFDPSLEWDGYATDTFTGLGSHTMDCGPAPHTPPGLGPLANRTVTEGQTLTFDVTAQPTDGDAVTLTASNLPPGATFAAAGESGTFTWTNAGPAGVYTARFYAADSDGTTSAAVQITVQAAPPVLTNALVRYSFEDAASNFTRAAAAAAAHVTAGLVSSADGSVTNYSGNPVWAISDTGFTGSNANYFAFTLSVESGYRMDVEGVRFSDQRSKKGPTAWALQYGGDGYAADLATGVTHASFATNQAVLSLTGLTGAVTFRVVGRSAGDATGTWRIDNLDLLGVVSPIAAPSAPGLIITSPTLRSFGFAVTSITLQGTATNVTGSMAWTNAGTHDSGAIAAANGWTLADLGLAVGLNPISVSASNAAGQSTSATLVVSREAAPSPAGTNVIVFQGFEPGDSWAIASGLAFASTSPGAADTPANQRVLSGGASWQVEGSVATLELAQASIAGYTGRVASLRLSATSGAPGAGLDAADQFRVFVALDGAPFPGFPDQPTLEVVAGAESAWGYDATNVYVADAGLRFFTAPAPDGLSSAACASLLVNLPDSATSIALRIHAACDPGEHWNVDDIAVRGGSVTDADGDGLPDAWELQYFASLTNAGAGTDADADGMSDVVEYLSGTVPTNPNSLLKAEAVSVTSGSAGFVIRWQSASNRVYTLDRADEPAGVYAGLASNLAATPPANLYTDAIPTNVTHVYRVRTQAP